MVQFLCVPTAHERDDVLHHLLEDRPLKLRFHARNDEQRTLSFEDDAPPISTLNWDRPKRNDSSPKEILPTRDGIVRGNGANTSIVP
jgi:hypothetical protein